MQRQQVFSVCTLLVFCSLLACKEQASVPPDTKATGVLIDTASQLRIADSLFTYARLLESKGKKDSAIYYYQETLKLRKGLIPDTALFVHYFEIGRLYRESLKMLLANQYLEDAKRLAEQNDLISPRTKVNLHLLLAYCKRELLNFGEARANIRSAQQIVRSEFLNDLYLNGRVSMAWANILYAERQYAPAVSSYEDAIHYFIQAGRNEAAASALLNISILHANRKQYAASLTYLDESLWMIRKTDGEESENVASRYLNKGGILQNLRQPDSAAFYFRRGLSIRQKIFGEHSVYTFGARAAFADFWLKQGQLDSAAHYFQKSIYALVRSYSGTLTTCPQPDHSEISKDLAWVLVEKSKVLTKMYDERMDQAMLIASIAHIRLADSVLSVHRRYLPFEDQQFALLRSEEAVYQQGLDIPYELGLHAALLMVERSGEERYLDDALHFMETSRAKRLADALVLAESYNSAGIPEEFHQQQNELSRKRLKILQAYSPDRSDSLDIELGKIGEQLNSINRKLLEINPNYLLTRYAPSPLKIEQLKRMAGEWDAVLLDYYWTDSILFVLAIEKKKTAFMKIDITRGILRSLDEVMMTLSDASNLTSKSRFSRFAASAVDLHNTLLPELVQNSTASRLIISPHGRLSFLPFEVLLEGLPDTTEVDYRLPYLVRRFSVSYTQAFQLLKRPDRRPGKHPSLLAMGFSTTPTGLNGSSRSGLSGLPGTEQEIESIREVVKNDQNAYFLGPDASETTLKNEISGYSIVHLAMHGESDSVNALNSRLLFRIETDSVNDGNLYAHELYGLNLKNTNLVVLSACESGIGKPQPGEGLLSIARGFAYAGCPSQVISLWKIGDRTSARIMGIFYRELSEGNEVDVALAQAKLSYLAGASEFNTHPFYWAAFLHVGDTQPVFGANSQWLYWIMGVCGLALILVAVYARRSRKGVSSA